MKTRRRKLSRWRIALLAASALLCGVSYGLPRLFPAGEAIHARAARLETERDRLSLIVGQAQGVAVAFAWTDSAIAALPASLGPGWHWAEAPPSDTTPGLLACSRTGLDEWPAIVDAVEKLHAHPGLRVDAAEITASGIHRQRRFEKIIIGVRLRTGGAPSE
ncbi:hypothetical protein OPIT5_22075 [Opitutaceae bacterium TAV5]|nr:hypothetical protein OPIT5_22075 [Opitutaceae bacterium TAV5]